MAKSTVAHGGTQYDLDLERPVYVATGEPVDAETGLPGEVEPEEEAEGGGDPESAGSSSEPSGEPPNSGTETPHSGTESPAPTTENPTRSDLTGNSTAGSTDTAPAGPEE